MEAAERYTVNRPSVIFDVQGDETVIIDLTNGHYYRLDSASTALWMRFDDGATPDEATAACDNPEELAPQLAPAIDELLAKSLLVAVGEAAAAAPTAAPSRWRFDGFALEEFTDLEDILGLDPIHEVDPERGWPHTRTP